MREFIRHPATVPIEIEELEGDVNYNFNTLSNVSFGGISCFSAEPIEKGKKLKIRVNCVNPDFEIIGKAIWCRAKNDLYEIGVEFVVTKDEVFHLRMVEQICHIEHYKNEILRTEGRELSSEEAAQEWIKKYADKFPET